MISSLSWVFGASAFLCVGALSPINRKSGLIAPLKNRTWCRIISVQYCFNVTLSCSKMWSGVLHCTQYLPTPACQGHTDHVREHTIMRNMFPSLSTVIGVQSHLSQWNRTRRRLSLWTTVGDPNQYIPYYKVIFFDDSVVEGRSIE